MTTATTLQMSFSSIGHLLSLKQASKQASKPLLILIFNKGLLLPDRSVNGHPDQQYSDIQSTGFLCLAHLYLSKFSQPRNPITDHRGFFVYFPTQLCRSP